ncbi:MAG TPA: cytochrome c peroxidase [Bacteriovoracaceae bacterium]|nr:cytochrome c peroxidase [Bacteriovoracaceae bacterium]
MNMKISFLVALLFCSTLSIASTTDRELQSYIQKFQIRALKYPGNKNEALFKLGLTLFFETALSGNNNISCHDCHSGRSHTSDWLPLGLGEGATGIADFRNQASGNILARHTTHLFNLGFDEIPNLFWDGRVSYHHQRGWQTPESLLNGPNPYLKEVAQTLDSLLAVQALFPIADPDEMLGKNSTLSRAQAWENAMERIFKSRFAKKYEEMFSAAFPGVKKYNIGHVANALAEFQRYQFLAINTPWDLYLRGRKDLMSERMKRGAILFYDKGQCVNCHTGDHMSSFDFQNIMIPHLGPGKSDGDDKGRWEITFNPNDIYKFRVTPLRNTALTPPYMHNGYLKTMWDVIDHYDHPMRSLMHSVWDPYGDPRYNEPLILDYNRDRIVQRARSAATPDMLPRFIRFTQEEKKDLYCFLMVGLTDLSLQDHLTQPGVLDEIDDCDPLIGYRAYDR